MFPNQANLNQLVGKKKRIRPRKQNPSSMKRKANRLINLASMSQYQAPHHDEPEDLTDDLAPKTSATNANVAQTAQQTQPGNIGADNKLNFKFQKTVQKTPNWAKYQNNFKTISGASPDREPDELQQYEKQNSESGSDQKTVELKQTEAAVSSNSNPGDAFSRLSPSVLQVVQEKLKQMPDKKPFIMPKPNEEDTAPVVTVPVVTTPVVKKVPSVTTTKRSLNQNQSKAVQSGKSSQKSAGSSTLKPIEVRFQQNKNFKADPEKFKNIKKIVYTIPYDYPKGIPKSFLTKDKKTLNELTMPPQNPTPRVPKTVPDYQEQASVDLPSWILPSQAQAQSFGQNSMPATGQDPGSSAPTTVQHASMPERPYSPSDVYSETLKMEEEARDGSESPDLLQSSQKRQSAFERLGPLTKPKKPKLTINLLFNKEQAVREVVGETEEASLRFVPVHLRRDILDSHDETVKKYLPFWPWKRNMTYRKTVSARFSKSVMILEQEQMETGYEKDSLFIMVMVKGYPVSWKKEDVLDALLECVKGKSFIPCFIEFTPQECKFLVIRSRAALVAIHKVGFCIRKNDVELTITIALTDTSLNQIDMIPRLVLRKRLMTNYDGEKTLDLTGFFIGQDVSHFVYFPLNRVTNQVELIQLQSAVAWEHLTELNLSNNRIASLDGFDLQSTTPKLRSLDLSHNLLDKITILLRFRHLPLRSIKLEGNPLCHDYIDSGHYIKVLKMIFSGLQQIDGVPLTLKGELPPMRINYCPEAAVDLIEKFLETFFPLLEAPQDDRTAIEDMYDKDAVLTITFRNKLRYGSAFRYFRNLFLFARNFEEGDCESVQGAHNIGNLVNKWPPVEHDRYTMTIDVLLHDDSTSIIRIAGIFKLTAETLAEDEHVLTFTRNIVLHTKNGVEYKIHNEMLYWDFPCEESMQTAFNITTVRPKQPSLKLETPPDEELKSQLLSIFVNLAGIDKIRGKRCLERKNWDLRGALDLYVKLLKLDDLSSLKGLEDEVTTPQPQPS